MQYTCGPQSQNMLQELQKKMIMGCCFQMITEISKINILNGNMSDVKLLSVLDNLRQKKNGHGRERE